MLHMQLNSSAKQKERKWTEQRILKDGGRGLSFVQVRCHSQGWLDRSMWLDSSFLKPGSKTDRTRHRSELGQTLLHEDRDKSLHQVRGGQVRAGDRRFMCATWYAKLTATLAAGGLQVDVILTVITLIPPLRWSGLYLFAHKTQSRTHTHEIHLCNTCWRFSFSCFSRTSHIQY